jgi:hypothetical protein
MARQLDRLPPIKPGRKVYLWILALCLGVPCLSMYVLALFRNDTSQSQQIPSGTSEVGSTVQLISQPNQVVYVGVDYSDLDALTKAIAAKDPEGVSELLESGRVFRVPNGTKARLLEVSFLARKVRILEGPHRSKAGWIETEFVQGLPSTPAPSIPPRYSSPPT